MNWLFLNYYCNLYCILGLITINCTNYPPCLYSLGLDNHDLACYMAFIINVVATEWLRRGDFVVVDNVIFHLGGHVDGLAKFLWNTSGINGEPITNIVHCQYVHV